MLLDKPTRLPSRTETKDGSSFDGVLRTINPGELAHRTFITDTVSHVRRPEDDHQSRSYALYPTRLTPVAGEILLSSG